MTEPKTLTADDIFKAWESLTSPLYRDALRIQTLQMAPADVAKMERVTDMSPLFGWKLETHDWMPPGFAIALDKDRKGVAVFDLREKTTTKEGGRA